MPCQRRVACFSLTLNECLCLELVSSFGFVLSYDVLILILELISHLVHVHFVRNFTSF